MIRFWRGSWCWIFRTSPEEPFYETNFEKKHFNHDFCKELSSHLVHLRNLPVQCKKYKDVVDDLKKRDMDDTANAADMS